MELHAIYAPDEMNEKIFNGKVMELKGRQLVANRGQGSQQIPIRACDRTGQRILGREAPSSTTTPPPPRSTRSTSPAPATPAPVIPKTAPATPAAKARASSMPAVATQVLDDQDELLQGVLEVHD